MVRGFLANVVTRTGEARLVWTFGEAGERIVVMIETATEALLDSKVCGRILPRA